MLSERGTHPDLLEEERASQAAAAEAPPPEPTPRRRSSGGTPARAEPSDTSAGAAPPPESEVPEAGDSTPTPAESSADGSPPEWFSQVREAKDPSEALKLLAKNLRYEQLEQDETLSGVIGRLSDRRAQELLRKQEAERQDRAKREAAQKGDLYALGELSAPEILERARREAAASASAPFMDGVALFQQALPDVIQEQVAGKTFGAGKGHAEGVKEYLAFITDEAVKLGVDRELRRRESALRKSVLSEVNGDEPVPERDSGTPSRVREVTDEQIAAMSQPEYEALFDPGGIPKAGVRHRSTRGVPLRRH